VPFGLTDTRTSSAAAPPAPPRHQLPPAGRSTGWTTGDNEVHLADGSTLLGYDVLVIATGAILLPEETEGLTGPGWNEKVFTFYTSRGPHGPGGGLESFEGGRIVVNVVDMPIKCPVAPLEFCFLADWFFTERGIRDKVKLTYVTPLDGAFTKPVAARRSAACSPRRASSSSPSSTPARSTACRAAARILRRARGPLRPRGRDPAARRRTLRRRSEGPRRRPRLRADRPADAAVERGAERVRDRRRHHRARRRRPARSPTSRARCWWTTSLHFLAGEELRALFDGHANCFIETGFGKAMLIDFNYDTEPLPGHFPGKSGAAAGRIAHQPPREAHVPVVLLARAAARRDIPGIGSDMPTAGKDHATHDQHPESRRRT
jgi:sulfide:quinone oxidoreductase